MRVLSPALWAVVLPVALLALVKAADEFTEAAEEIGLHFRIPAYVVGVTIVAVGTSLPELVSSLVAVGRGAPEIVLATVVGSNVTNIFLVLGVAAILGRRLFATYEIIHVDLPLLMGSAFLLAVVAWDGEVDRLEAVACVAGAVIYTLYAVAISVRRARPEERELREEVEEELGVTEAQPLSAAVYARLGASSVVVYFAAEATVRSVIEVAGSLGVSSDVIAMSAVALGTSLPELTVSLAAARRGNLEIAIGNVLGSSVFNSLAVVGVPGLIVALPVAPNVLAFGLPMMVVASLLYFFMAQDREITRWEGWILVLFYGVYFLGLLRLR